MSEDIKKAARDAAWTFARDNVKYADEDGRLADQLEDCDPETETAETCDGCEKDSRAVFVAFYRGFMRGQPEWIPVSERLPEVGEWCFLAVHVDDEPVVQLAERLRDGPRPWFHTNRGLWCGLESVTHWTPLPTPPTPSPKPE